MRARIGNAESQSFAETEPTPFFLPITLSLTFQGMLLLYIHRGFFQQFLQYYLPSFDATHTFGHLQLSMSFDLFNHLAQYRFSHAIIRSFSL